MVRVSGPKDSVELATIFWRRIAEECARRGYHRVLVIEDIAVHLTTTEMFEFVTRMPELGLLGIVIAFVDLDVKQFPHYMFGETVAQNRGIVAKVFETVAEAEQWLAALPKD